MKLDEMILEDLLKWVKNTLTGNWNIKRVQKGILLDLGDAESDKYIEMEMRVSGKKVEVNLILYSGDETYFSEEKTFDSQVELMGSLKKVDRISNMTIDEILAETNYSELHGSKDIL